MPPFNTNGGNHFPPPVAKVLLRITFDSAAKRNRRVLYQIGVAASRGPRH